jgi:hypothetical protein
MYVSYFFVSFHSNALMAKISACDSLDLAKHEKRSESNRPVQIFKHSTFSSKRRISPRFQRFLTQSLYHFK